MAMPTGMVMEAMERQSKGEGQKLSKKMGLRLSRDAIK